MLNVCIFLCVNFISKKTDLKKTIEIIEGTHLPASQSVITVTSLYSYLSSTCFTISNHQQNLPTFYLGFVMASLKLKLPSHFLEPNMQYK